MHSESSLGDPRHRSQILVVEDDVPLATLIRRRLEGERYGVDLAHDGEAAANVLQEKTLKHDLLILDLNLPKIDGLTLLRQLRPRAPKLPVLVLTALSALEDKVLSLNAGADDCMSKPFFLVELSARIRALLRRTVQPVEELSRMGELLIDRAGYRVERAGKPIALSSREFTLLDYLVRNAGRTVTRAELMENVWKQSGSAPTNLVDVYVKYVRDKVDAGFDFKLIRTVRGIGYVFSDK